MALKRPPLTVNTIAPITWGLLRNIGKNVKTTAEALNKNAAVPNLQDRRSTRQPKRRAGQGADSTIAIISVAIKRKHDALLLKKETKIGIEMST